LTIKVLNTFKEKEHKGTIYQIGDTYPKGKFKADPKRVSFLQEEHPVYGVRFLSTPESTSTSSDVEDKEPVKKSSAKAKKSDAK